MPYSEIERNRVISFAENWITRNIHVGPFSCNDRGFYDGPVRQFRTEAARAGLDEAQLDCVIGPVAEFIAAAFTSAASTWRAGAEIRRRIAAHRV